MKRIKDFIKRIFSAHIIELTDISDAEITIKKGKDTYIHIKTKK